MQQWQVTSLENSGTSRRKFIVCSQIPSVVVVDKKYIMPKWKPFQTQTGMSNAKISKWYTRCHWLVGIQKKIETLFAFFGTPCMFTRAQSNPHMTHLDSSRRTLMASRTGQTLWFQKTERRAKTAVVREMYSIKGLLISMVARLSACHWCFDMLWCYVLDTLELYISVQFHVLRARSTVPASEQRLLRSYGPSRGITGDRIHM